MEVFTDRRITTEERILEESYEREIISSFPYPIARVFIRLRTEECSEPGPNRLKYILATAEAVSRFLGMVVLCECRDFLEKPGVAAESQGATASRELAKNFEKCFSEPSWGFWNRILRQGIQWMTTSARKPFVSELATFFTGSNAANMFRLLEIRNGLSHDKLKAMYRSEYKALCEETSPLLRDVLYALAFLPSRQLTVISHIELEKRRTSPPQFLHRFKKVSGSHEDFASERKSMSFYMDPGAVVLLDPEGMTCLNLDPLLVYEEEAGDAPDIFFYNGLKANGTADYSGCSRGGSFDSRESPRAVDIHEELRLFVTLFQHSNQSVPTT